MPIYEYRCEKCGHVFEEIQRFSDPDPEECPSCGAAEVGRIVSRSSFQLKGGGWYAQDYSSTGSSASKSSSTSSSAPASSSGETSSASTGAKSETKSSTSSSSAAE